MESLFFYGSYIFICLIIFIFQFNMASLSRSNIVLGLRIPENYGGEEELLSLVKSYRKGLVVFSLAFLLAASLLVYYGSKKIFLATSLLIFYILASFLVYGYYQRKLRELKKERDWTAEEREVLYVQGSSVLYGGRKGFFSWSRLALIFPLINLFLGIYAYPALGQRIPIHWDLRGQVDGHGEKSILLVFLPVIFQVFFALIIYMAYYAMMTSKHELGPGETKEALKAYEKFLRAWDRFFKITLLGLELIFSLIFWTMLDLVDFTRLFLGSTIIYTLIILVLAFYISFKYGQGGDRLIKSKGQDRNFYREDDHKWIFASSIYKNREDPALFVEKRWSIGWTINIGRPLGLGIFLFTIVLTLGLLYLVYRGLK